MSRNIRVSEPSAEMQIKIIRAKDAIASQKPMHFLLAGASIVLSSVFQALGNGVFSLIVSVCRQLFVLLPAAWLLAQTGNVNNVWWAFLIAEIVSVLLSLGFYARINKNIIAPMYSPAE